MAAQFDAVAGQAYMIQVLGTLGRLSLALEPSGADEPTGAPALSGYLPSASGGHPEREYGIAFGFALATLTNGVPSTVETSDDGQVAIARDVWVKAPAGAQVATCGLTDADTTLSVYTILGDGGAGRFVTANHRAVAGENGSCVYIPWSGNQYLVRVGLKQGTPNGRGFVAGFVGSPPTERRCTIDIAGLGGTYGPDQQITTDDLVLYLGAFFQNDMTIADKVTIGGTGQPDSVVSVDDLVFFLSQFFGSYNQCRVN